MNLHKYKSLRRIGCRAKDAIRSARHVPEYDVDFSGLRWGGTTSIEAEGFDIHVELEPHRYCDLEDENIGSYSDSWEPGAIKRPNPGWNEYKYFLPEARNWPDSDINDPWLVAQGMPRHERAMADRRQAYEQYKLSERMNDGYVYAWVVRVTVSKRGVTLGKAYYTIGLVDFDNEWWEDHVSDNAQDAILEALDEARRKLEELKR